MAIADVVALQVDRDLGRATFNHALTVLEEKRGVVAQQIFRSAERGCSRRIKEKEKVLTAARALIYWGWLNKPRILWLGGFARSPLRILGLPAFRLGLDLALPTNEVPYLLNVVDEEAPFHEFAKLGGDSPRGRKDVYLLTVVNELAQRVDKVAVPAPENEVFDAAHGIIKEHVPSNFHVKIALPFFQIPRAAPIELSELVIEVFNGFEPQRPQEWRPNKTFQDVG